MQNKAYFSQSAMSYEPTGRIHRLKNQNNMDIIGAYLVS